MKRTFYNYSLLLIALLFSSGIYSQPLKPFTDDEKQIASEMEDVLVKNILHVYYPAIIDTVNGGFYTNFDSKWKPVQPIKEKMIVTQARDIWTACQAATRYPADTRYKQAADHGFKFLRDVMWDNKFGGFYNYRGMDENKFQAVKYKQAYGNAFAIYALSAYYKLTGKEEALELAKKDFMWLEKNSHDALKGGYFNMLSPEGYSVINPKFDDKDKYFPNNGRYKDYNSSIHLLEAFTSLYGVWPDTLVRKRLVEMLDIVRDTLTHPKGYLQLYFDRNWQHISFADSSEHYRKINFEFDHISFGHDMETAYLLLEASKALNLQNDTVTSKVAKKIIAHSMSKGFDIGYTGIFDGGNYNKNDSMIITSKTKVWWEQAEALNALFLYSRLYPDNKEYKYAAYRMWYYIKNYLIDYENGDWYYAGLDSSPYMKYNWKASEWKANYHICRSLINCLELLQK